jgi:hypothetical protein
MAYPMIAYCDNEETARRAISVSVRKPSTDGFPGQDAISILHQNPRGAERPQSRFGYVIKRF